MFGRQLDDKPGVFYCKKGFGQNTGLSFSAHSPDWCHLRRFGPGFHPVILYAEISFMAVQIINILANGTLSRILADRKTCYLKTALHIGEAVPLGRQRTAIAACQTASSAKTSTLRDPFSYIS